MVENQCETNCESHGTMKESTNKCTETSCGCETTSCNSFPCCDTNPISAAKSLLESSFYTALKEVHVEKLKKIIEKEWGTTIDKAVELTIKTVEKQWQTSLTKSTANKEFYNELEKIFTSGK
jgi:hypothetical protein